MPARIVIGVTGHRKLAAEASLAAAVDAVLDGIERTAAADESGTVRLTVLSPLAEGADRLVARRALAREGAELEAVLPMDEKEYAGDFRGNKSKAEFEKLLARARSVRRLPAAASRDETYAQAGRYVVDHCDVLIALWDGKPEEGRGGTAEVVRYARKRGRRLYIINTRNMVTIHHEAGRGFRRGLPGRRQGRVDHSRVRRTKAYFLKK